MLNFFELYRERNAVLLSGRTAPRASSGATFESLGRRSTNSDADPEPGRSTPENRLLPDRGAAVQSGAGRSVDARSVCSSFSSPALLSISALKMYIYTVHVVIHMQRVRVRNNQQFPNALLTLL